MKIFLLASPIFILGMGGPSVADSPACHKPPLGQIQPCPGEILAVVEDNGTKEAILDNTNPSHTYKMTSGGGKTGTICQFYCYSSLGSTKLHAQITNASDNNECAYDAYISSKPINIDQLVPIGSPNTPISGQILDSDPRERAQGCGSGPAAFYGNFYTHW